VALASVFARYSFLKKMEIIEKKYGVKIPLGSGFHVPVFAKEFIKKYGYDAYCSIVKQNFKTHKQIVIDLGL
jgi:ribonuclease HIII